ncbi:MAG TPA: tetratricopeptide repeat protein [bacterium]|jgi:tetratricopeptide (TPR) repeat protein|nr:tetratricopeptide repeat protein [bacterium]
MADQKSLIIKLAHIYYHTGSWDKAIVEYEKIVGMDPADFNVHMTLGELYLKKGDLERAYKEFELSANGYMREKNVKKAAGSFREMANLIQKMVEPQDLQKAIGMYKDILGKLPESTETMTNLRDLYLRHNQIPEAISYTLSLGDLYNRLDYVDKAENEYIKAATLDPAHAGAQEKLEQLRNELKQAKP